MNIPIQLKWVVCLPKMVPLVLTHSHWSIILSGSSSIFERSSASSACLWNSVTTVALFAYRRSRLTAQGAKRSATMGESKHVPHGPPESWRLKACLGCQRALSIPRFLLLRFKSISSHGSRGLSERGGCYRFHVDPD